MNQCFVQGELQYFNKKMYIVIGPYPLGAWPVSADQPAELDLIPPGNQ